MYTTKTTHDGKISDKGWDLEDGFEHCSKGFSGSLVIRSTQGYAWTFHFFMGRIIGESGGIHPLRRWRRLLLQHCEQPFSSEDGLSLCHFKTDAAGCLERMIKRSQISREQALQVAKISLLDSLFDVLQQEHISRQSTQFRLTYEVIPESDSQKGALPWIFFRPKETLQEALQAWFSWQQQQLGACSPNWAPIFYGTAPLSTHPLAKEVFPLVDGERTLRDLSTRLQQNTLDIVQLLLPFVQSGAIGLKSVGDVSVGNVASLKDATVPPVTAAPKPLVAYVDDNLLEGQLMGKILQQMGCDYVHIHDPLKAVPMLLKHKPDLIFLDLVMPIVNGYEVCAQLRRISIFEQIPIIILTANDGLIDRVRAKVVGSTDFVSKPIDREKVLTILTKFQLTSSQELQRNPLKGGQTTVPMTAGYARA